ncbi:MAG TPA: hypothetical protein VLO10_05495 [Candidatus Deferrimicrobium sp.]|nr:hypothetical protein [Candidatus Deferrimicrobium sp.]
MQANWYRAALVPVVLGLAGATAATVHAAQAPAAMTFAPVIDLGSSGGEPSIQDDGHGFVYITSPAGIPAGLNQTTGVELWRSVNGGVSFSQLPNVGSQIGGGDSDVTADHNSNVYTADLEAAAADVQFSSDHATTFTTPGTQTGPDDDREWLTPVGDVLYLTYHDFVNNVPLIYKSTDHGTTFTPAGAAGAILTPTNNATAFQDSQQGTLVSKPVADAKGNIFVLINTSTAAQNAQNPGSTGPLDRLYLAESTDGGSTFTVTLVNDVSNGGTGSGSWGKVFNQLAIDNGGNLYIAAAGNLKSSDPVRIFLIRGHNNGGTYTWDAPLPLTSGFSQVFPAIAVGQAGQVAVGYYGTTAATGCNSACQLDYRNSSNKFQFYIAETLDALDAAPAFTTNQVTTTSPHPGGICTDGILCGTPQSAGGNRNLADFESMTVDPNGSVELVIPADQDGVHTHNLFYKQTGGSPIVPGPTNGNGTGNQTFVATPASGVPEIAFAPALIIAGVGAGLFVVRRRNRALS